MKIALIMPTHFDPQSVIAGGERYAYEISKALALRAEVTLFTFSEKEKIIRDGKLTLHYCRSWYAEDYIMNPVSFSHLVKLGNFDVIHCLQFRTLVTETSILLGALLGKKVFATDLAGGTIYCLSRIVPVHRFVKKFLLISEFNKTIQKDAHDTEIIYGGVDTSRFSPGHGKEFSKTLLYVGRIFPLKGLHVLLDALPQDCRLEIAGQCHDQEYLKLLKEKSLGKNVDFFDSLSDEEIIVKYRKAAATVLPSLIDGGFTSSMESMACGTPVIGTRVGSLPEVVTEGKTGFLVSPDDAAALRNKIEEFVSNPDLAARMGVVCREEALQRFTWEKVADRCLKIYEETA